jgi:von Willebrand factor type A C-terminal domain/von Willebrand factor type A domain
MATFTLETYQNEYLPAGGDEVNAVVTVTAEVGGDSRAPAAEIIMVDASGSMEVPPAKMRAARLATSAAIDCLHDGVLFAVIAGTETATLVFPPSAGLAPGSSTAREAARRAVGMLNPGGGTAIGRWLALANELFGTSPERICHAILLTDGEDRDETPEELDRVLDACKGRFQCECRGVGTDWRVDELRRIASALLGSVDIIPQPDDMAADLRSMIETAMGKQTDDVALRLWTPRGATVAFVRQVSPTIEELTENASAVNEQTADYPTGAWGDETRDYHVCVRVPAHEVGDELLAARVRLVVGEEIVGQSLIRALWTDEERLSTRISPEVAHYTGQTTLAEAIREGLEARRLGDDETATIKLGHAVRLATATGNGAIMRLLANVVEVHDPTTGTVRLRRHVDQLHEMTLDTRSTRTVRSARGGRAR